MCGTDWQWFMYKQYVGVSVAPNKNNWSFLIMWIHILVALQVMLRRQQGQKIRSPIRNYCDGRICYLLSLSGWNLQHGYQMMKNSELFGSTCSRGIFFCFIKSYVFIYVVHNNICVCVINIIFNGYGWIRNIFKMLVRCFFINVYEWLSPWMNVYSY